MGHDVPPLEVGAVFYGDGHPIPQRRHERLLHGGHGSPIGVFDLHGVVQPELAFLDLQAHVSLHVLEVQGLWNRRALPSTLNTRWPALSSIQESSPIEINRCRIRAVNRAVAVPALLAFISTILPSFPKDHHSHLMTYPCRPGTGTPDSCPSVTLPQARRPGLTQCG